MLINLKSVFSVNQAGWRVALLATLLSWAGSAFGDYVVSDAGTEDVNGIYVYWDDVEGVAAYRKEGGDQTWYLCRGHGGWVINDHDYCGMGYYTNYNESDTPPAEGWEVHMGMFPAPTVGPAGPGVSLSSKQFLEGLDNDGSIVNTLILTHNQIDGDGFNGTVDEDFLTAGKAFLTNLPPNLGATLIYQNDGTLELALIGQATNHDNSNTVADLTLTFANSAFISGDASLNSNSLVDNLVIQFRSLHSINPGDLIADAIAVAANYDIIQLSAGVFTEKDIYISQPENIAIIGAGADQTIVQAMETPLSESGRVFQIQQPEQGETIIRDLTIRHGNSVFHGGAIYAYSPLTLENCRLTMNQLAVPSMSFGYKAGGAVFADTLYMDGCLVDENSANNTVNPSVETSGGAIFVLGTAIVKNSTFINNDLNVVNAYERTQGGAISVSSSANVTLINTTLANNTTTGYGGGIGQMYPGGSVTIINSILFGNTSGLSSDTADLSVFPDTLLTYRHSIIGAGTVGDIEDNLLSADPLLQALADNGGPTQTLALGTSSPAISLGMTGNDIPVTDQRGYCRVGSIDAGAYQANGFTLTLLFDGNGADSGEPPVYNCQPTFPGANSLVKSGYELVGWNTANDGSGDAYQPGDAIDLETDQTWTLYAQWGPVSSSSTKRDLVLSFPTLGTYQWLSNSTWQRLHLQPANVIAVADLDANGVDDLILSYPDLGTWRWWNNAVWQQLHTQPVDVIAVADLDTNGVEDLILSFPDLGTWRWLNNAAWQQLHTQPVDVIAVADLDTNGVEDLIISFPDLGTWRWLNNAAWQQLHTQPVDVIAVADLDANGVPDLILSFPDLGTWRWLNNAAWQRLHSQPANVIAVADLDANGVDDLILSFPDLGTWRWWNNAAWQRLHSQPVEAIAVADLDANGVDDLILSFPDLGTWRWLNNTAWQQLHTQPAKPIVGVNFD